MNSKWIISSLVLIALTSIAVGCSQQPQTFPISGMVTLDGKPLTSGNIRFAPTDGSPEVRGATVTNGEYELDCLPGEKIVQVAGFLDNQTVVPMRYITTDSGLKANITEPTELDFELSTKRSRRRR
ncbi:hypothetical protein ACYFX5_22470 [Bremerella sp. T1]|uniref:hypothetical protein n=1 Tax=Bremerella sp. TYQ1 TaxID=3119568 RepID=UPI001CCBBAB8|nr:hypothetical protein [Bremerella volcania]UBM35802.1 hypothetical protein LA756_24410 [Bremerella volcania]